MNIPKNNKEKIQYYLIDKAKSFIENNFQYVCLKFYDDYQMNFYYLYYKFTQEIHPNEFKEKILSTKSFFRYSIVQRNYLNCYNNTNENFTVSIDKSDYDKGKI